MTQRKPQDEDRSKGTARVLGRIPLLRPKLRPEWERAVLPWGESRVRAADPDLADVLADLDAKALSVMKVAVESGDESTAIVTATAALRSANEPLANLFQQTQSLQDVRAELRRTLDTVRDRLPEEGPFAEDVRRVRTWAEFALGISESEIVGQPGLVGASVEMAFYRDTKRDVDKTLQVLGRKRREAKKRPSERLGLWRLSSRIARKYDEYIGKPKSEYAGWVARLAGYDLRSRWSEDTNRLGLTPKDSRKRQRQAPVDNEIEDSSGAVDSAEPEQLTLTPKLRKQLNSEAGDSGEVGAESTTLESAYQRELFVAIEAAMQDAPDDEIALAYTVLRNGGQDWSAARRELGQKTRATEKRLKRRLEKSEELRRLVTGE